MIIWAVDLMSKSTRVQHAPEKCVSSGRSGSSSNEEEGACEDGEAVVSPDETGSTSGDLGDDLASEGEISESCSSSTSDTALSHDSGTNNTGSLDESLSASRAIERKKSNRKRDFFHEESVDVYRTFAEYNLSRAILRAIATLKFDIPTPVQARMIPLALRGRDLCVSAVTGSGKTAAFVIPILERLMYRDLTKSVIRVLILVPTRELGIQCHNTIRDLSMLTTVQSALCIGGIDQRAQNAQLSKRPDVIVATPGRLIDHIANTGHFNLDTIEILVIDEADKMLETGFFDELHEIINNIPKDRQTMLLSATMTDKVERLAGLSLKNPVRLFIDTSRTLPKTLVQEFVRVRNNRLESKPSILLSLCANVIKSPTIVFFNEKYTAHKMKVLFDLCGYSAAELHGNLTQKQRVDALEGFKNKKTGLLFSTDVAARGIDIYGVKNIINYDMPKMYSQYIHRVGRTARAGASGRSVSLVCDADRRLVKHAITNSPSRVKHRIMDPEVLEKCNLIIESHTQEMEQILENEKFQRDCEKLEMKVKKTENIMLHRKEILSRPKKIWFKTNVPKKRRTGSSAPGGAEGKERTKSRLRNIKGGKQQRGGNTDAAKKKDRKVR